VTRLTSLRSILVRQERQLEECADDTASALLCAVKALSREVSAVIEVESGIYDAHAADLLTKGLDLLDRIREYDAQTHRGWFVVQTPAPKPSEGTIMATSEQMFALAHRMAPGATEPPAVLREAAEEAQGIGRFTTAPSPPPDGMEPMDVATKPTTREKGR
jgi:hypothetical protein